MRISLVVAASENRVIGAAGGIPWRLPDDQKLFKQLTLGHCILMGRSTFESIGRLLPGRTTIVLSRDTNFTAPGALVAHDLDSALALTGEQADPHADERSDADDRSDREAFVVGGAAVYELALPRADFLHLTRVHAELEGDVLFPDFECGDYGAWKLLEEIHHPADERHAYAFTYQHWGRPDSPAQSPPG